MVNRIFRSVEDILETFQQSKDQRPGLSPPVEAHEW